jgi:hypothetical protein
MIGDFECCARHSQPGMGIAAEGRLGRRFGHQSRKTPASPLAGAVTNPANFRC